MIIIIPLQLLVSEVVVRQIVAMIVEHDSLRMAMDDVPKVMIPSGRIKVRDQ